jgi:hypothetical protein
MSLLSSFRSQHNPHKNEVIRNYNMKKTEFSQRIKTLQDIVEISYPDGGFYIGQINANKMKDGKGIYTYVDGDIYFGAWKDDSFNGQGVYIFANGEIFDGLLLNGIK